MLNDYMKQNGIIYTFQNLKTLFVSLFYLDFIKPTNVSDHFAGACTLGQLLIPLEQINFRLTRLSNSS